MGLRWGAPSGSNLEPDDTGYAEVRNDGGGLYQRIVGPAVPVGGFAHHHDTARTHESHGELEGARWRSEPTGHRAVEPGTIAHHNIANVGSDHVDAARPPKTTNDAFEEVRTFGATVDQGHSEVGTIMGDHQTRYTTACAEIDDRADGRLEGVDEAPSMLDHLIDRTGTEEPDPLRVTQRREQRW
jgi:hypothetical protein